MKYQYWLPKKEGEQTIVENHETESNAVIIIGANGSGKSKLGAWIERQKNENVHRIGGQRNLNFQDHITLKSFSEAEDRVFYGTAESSTNKNQKGYRWGWGKYTTQLLNDYEDVLYLNV